MEDSERPLISRDTHFAQPKRETTICRKFTILLTPADLFRLLGLPEPPEGANTHILLARSHGNDGSYYNVQTGGNLVEVRIHWEEPFE